MPNLISLLTLAFVCRMCTDEQTTQQDSEQIVSVGLCFDAPQ